MVVEKNRNANFHLSSRERKQLLLWGSILIVAMLGLIYLITPSGNPPEQPAPEQQQTRNANHGKPVSARP
jgi:hypothetical protein